MTGNVQRIYKFGEKGSDFRREFKFKYEAQDFDLIRKRCLENKELFEDNYFPMSLSSFCDFYREIGISINFTESDIKWLRPTELSMKFGEKCKFSVEGFDRFDIRQGNLGDCWFLATLDNLTLHPRFFSDVIPHDQDFDNNYAGIFHFRFWHNDRWIDVPIDDRLPTVNDELVFVRSSQRNEFWSALIEKAYAKFLSAYVNPSTDIHNVEKRYVLNVNMSPYCYLDAGVSNHALNNFTGSLMIHPQTYENFHSFEDLLDAYKRTSIITIDTDESEYDNHKKMGLVSNHVYSVTRVANVEVSLLRCYNPHDERITWKGRWSIESEQWNCVPDSVKNTLKLEEKEFWISHHEFCKKAERSNSGVEEFPAKITIKDLWNNKNDYVIIKEMVNVKVPLIRIRNPWGNAKEWKGQWSDDSDDWNEVGDEDRENFRFTKKEDGEFWMCYNDVRKYFSGTQIYGIESEDWKIHSFKGEWIQNFSAGGPPSDWKSFEKNPKYTLKIFNDDGKPCMIAVELKASDPNCQGINISICEENHYEKRFVENFKKFEEDAVLARGNINSSFVLPIGTYYIVPHTSKTNVESQFSLRILTKRYVDIREDDVKNYIPSLNNILTNTPSLHATLETVYEVFQKVAGEDKEIDWMELKQVFDYTFQKDKLNKEFSKETFRSLISLVDNDGSGKLGLEEFKFLWTYIHSLQNAFKQYDPKFTGMIPIDRLKDAFNAIGYTLDRQTLSRLIHRYGSKSGCIDFDDFILCALRFKTMMDANLALTSMIRNKQNDLNEDSYFVSDILGKFLY